jgi:hypothetical protein
VAGMIRLAGAAVMHRYVDDAGYFVCVNDHNNNDNKNNNNNNNNK